MPRRVFPPRIDALDISISRRERLEGYVWFAIGVFVRPGISENFFVHRPTETEENFDASIAKAWLQECLRSHAQCKVAGSGVMPSRPLRVSRCDASFRVNLETNLPDIIRFVFLSYRWGGDQKLKLTETSVDELQAVLVLQPSLVSSVQDPFLHNRAARQRKE
ncbi:hypothetical protein F5Y07DRAFT_212232 [Xylaria sp. FL0933]|nr:hypothetical protein F5Y07DRAFT_212232 [Xylaria sp. FL0933]